MTNTLNSRRRLLQYALASPLLLGSNLLSPSTRHLLASDGESIIEEIIDSADEAINVFDLKAVAKKRLRPAHWTYLDMGAQDEVTLVANRQGFRKFYLRPKRLVNVAEVDKTISLFGMKLNSPIIAAPAGGQAAFHPLGETEVAAGTAASNNAMIYSTAASMPLEKVNELHGSPAWFQLYVFQWSAVQAMVKRAENAGCKVLVLTVDFVDRHSERFYRYRRATNPECLACHDPKTPSMAKRPMLQGVDPGGGYGISAVGPGGSLLTWDIIQSLRDITDMKIVIKGISTAEDASLCVEYGADGLVVSNHGGRGPAAGRSTIESLAEVVTAVDRRIPVLIDGGFRRGTDIVMALALGADAVLIGRPYLWGLSAFGKDGVEKVFRILDRELEYAMRQAGTPSIASIDRANIGTY